MFLPRIQSRLFALLLVIGTIYLITMQWGTPKVPKTFSEPFGEHASTSKSPLRSPTSSGSAVLLPLKSPAVPIAVKPPSAPSKKASESKAPTKIASNIEAEYTPLPKEPAIAQPTIQLDEPKSSPPAHNVTLNVTRTAATKEGQIAFWKEFASLLAAGKPDCPPPTRLSKTDAQSFDHHPTERYDVLEMPDSDVTKMQKAHEKFVDGLQGKAAELVYTPGTRGLVTTAGGPYLPVFAVSLRMLRRTGTTLPMEVFLADEQEYESYICEEVFPTLDAKCVILSDILEAVPHAVEIKHYQFKVFAMIFSSFEEVLFLDSDAFPVHDAEYLFTKEPFLSHGLVTWPDYWASTASHLYYKIAGKEVPPLSLRQSTESGELLLNKKTHSKSFLLATYYNYYGSHYYILFSQGAPGEGDKETFIAAAYALNQTFYQVAEPVRAIGHGTSLGWTGTAMVQFDPVQDYDLTRKGKYRNKDKDAAGPIRPFFLHVNYPRYNPAKVFDHKEHTINAKGEQQRIWQGADTIIAMFNQDIEKQVWEEVKWVSCELEHKFEGFKNKEDICDKATKHYEGLWGKTEQEPKKTDEAASKPTNPSKKPEEATLHPFGASSKQSR